jgi:hypothetical protein
MNPCKGEPAEKYALAYVEGSLDEEQAARFEEHFIACRICQTSVIELQDLAEEFYKHPVSEESTQAIHTARNGSRLISFLRPNPAWGLLAFASLLLIGVLLVRSYWHGTTGTDQAKTTVTKSQAEQAENTTTHSASPAAAPSSDSESKISATQLADLTLPAFNLRNLRTANTDARYLAGMQAYNAGNCSSAIGSLSQLPAAADDPHATQFFIGICQLHLGNLQAARKALKAFAASGDSPQFEWTLYELAQVALASNDPSTAHSYLAKTIALHGDLEAKARAEDGKVAALLSHTQQSQKP